MAHFAITLIGLVAVIGAWRDSSLSFGMMVGALALLMLAAWWLVHLRRTRPVALPTCTVCCLGWLGAAASTWHSWAFFLRRANRLAGPPTRFVLPFVRGGRLERVMRSKRSPFLLCVGSSHARSVSACSANCIWR